MSSLTRVPTYGPHVRRRPRPSSTRRLLALSLLALTTTLTGATASGAATISLVSVGLDGTVTDRFSLFIGMSGDGRYVAFSSDALDIAPPCTQPVEGFLRLQLFLRDLDLGTTTCASVSSAEAPGNGSFTSGSPSVSTGGRFVAFSSDADNLAAGCPGSDPVSPMGFLLRDTVSGTTTCLAGGSKAVFNGVLSANGGFAAFATQAALDLACAGGGLHVYVRNVQTSATTCASVSSGGQAANGSAAPDAISASGRHIGFRSGATNLAAPCTKGTADLEHVFVRDTVAGTTTCATVSGAGAAGNGQTLALVSLSDDGRLVAFVSRATNLDPACASGSFQAYLRDLVAGTTRCLSGGGGANDAAISGDGSIFAFTSNATTLDPVCNNGENHIYARLLATGSLTCLSVNGAGQQGNGDNGSIKLTTNGRRIAFLSDATNLVPGDTNGRRDAFVVEVVFPQPQPTLTIQLNGTSFQAGDELVVTATLTPGTTPTVADAYVVVQLPNDGPFFSVHLGNVLVPGLSPIVANFLAVAFSGEVFHFTFPVPLPPIIPSGLYRFLAALTQPNTFTFIGPVIERPFNVVRP